MFFNPLIMSTIKEFTADAGEYSSPAKSKELIEKTEKEREKRGQKKADYIHSQFFGKEKLEELLRNTGPDCVGFKINLILEGAGADEEGVLIQAVDKEGKVLSPGADAEEKNGVYAGPKCPTVCIPPPGGGN